MGLHINQIYLSYVNKIDTQRHHISEQDFLTGNLKPALFVIFINAALENFLSVCFKELIKIQQFPPETKEYLTAKASNFSLKDTYPLLCTTLLPMHYRKSEILKKMYTKRNAYAHRIIDSNGNYIFLSNDKCTLSLQEIDEFIVCTKNIMERIKSAVESQIND